MDLYWNWAASHPWQNLAFVVLPLIVAAFRIALHSDCETVFLPAVFIAPAIKEMGRLKKIAVAERDASRATERAEP